MKNRYSYLVSTLLVFLISSAFLFPSVGAEEEYCPLLYQEDVDVELLDYQPCTGCGLFYMKISLSGIPINDPPYSVEDGVKFAYCMQEDKDIAIDEIYDGYLICTYNDANPNLPDWEWDKINYILNHKNGDWEDVQEALWIYTGDINYIDASTLAKAMYDLAEANGSGYKPGSLEKLGVYIYLPVQYDPYHRKVLDVQDLLIEIELPFDYKVPEVPLGTLATLATMITALFIKMRREK